MFVNYFPVIHDSVYKLHTDCVSPFSYM